MSTASTPRSTRSASPGNSPNMLTPGQKIKAMMAQFGSDSESDSENTRPKHTISKLDFGSKHKSAVETQKFNQSNNSRADSDDDEDIVRPKGRMAARMQGGDDQSEQQQDTAFSRLSKALRMEREQADKAKPRKKSPAPDAAEAGAESSEDDLPAAPRRNKKAARQKSPDADNQSRNSSPRARSDSPLFVSSPAPTDEQDQDEDADADEGTEQLTKGNARFLALVAQKRKEREDREKIEEEKKAARRAQLAKFSSDIVSGEESEAEDPGSAHKLSQKAHQPRKASKKAMDEIRQETQRMSRNMQLAHQAQTKKKISKESFFARFNFGQPEASAEPAQVNSSSATGSQQSSDAEARKARDTPHTSPALGPSTEKSPVDASAGGQSVSNVKETTLIANQPAMNKAAIPNELKVPQESTILPSHPAARKEPFKFTGPAVRVLMSRQEIAQHQQEDSDSDDLEVVTSPAKARRIAAFENLPAQKLQESASMIRLKALAHLTSPTRKTTSMTSSELSASLLYKARQQAAKERRERIDELRAKGVVIETAEERAAMEEDMEDLVEKARREADEIKRLERAAKKNEQDLDDEEDDGDYEFSGSEEEEEGPGDDDDARSLNGNEDLVEEEADDGDESSDGESDVLPSDVEDGAPGTRRKRPTRVVSDDEDEDEPQKQVPSTPVRAPSNPVQSVERPNFLGMETPSMSMGLTQAFAGTLADDNDGQSQLASATIPFSLPDPGRPVPRLRHEDSEILVRDSQEQPDEPDFMANYHQNTNRVSESPAGPAFSQYSQLPDPTQDQGFVLSPFDPNKRFRGTPPVSTVDTVIVGQSQSPIVERKSRQLRRGRAADLSVVQEEEETNEVDPNAFDIMKKAKKPIVAFDKKNSKAKNIVDEAAEESEDEYAGLGGASGDDSDEEENAYDKQMINDNSGETVDEKELAALNAVHDRNRDEKDVAKLLKDITTGALRRRRGADDDFDLDDSDDEHLARRREKQREFAKMRKALLADNKIGELADNPKKAAFFKAIEDREVEDDFELEFLEEGGSQNESQATEERQDGAANDSNKRKRPLEPSADSTNRPPPNLRRTPASAMSKKPATLAEIRETLSFLTETPEYDSFQEDASVNEEDPEEGDDSNTSGAEAAHSDDASSQPKEDFVKPSHPRRTRGPVVDRLALLRQASSNSATATTGPSNTKLAFQTGGNGDGPIGFRPPPLLHRVSSGSSSSSNASKTSNRVSKPAASGPKKGGAVNSYTAAREKERERQLRVKQRNGSSNVAKLLNKHAGGGLGALAGKGQWD
ncbi:hypothetical protein N7520_003719 [Penicillium odoratum]|uniref:uncharacterized protein n=1 Tax=Penicillium odoratum TaxID=1167516 RepID=UPI00254667CC|nr:uncharacterized protein N7520_003719 [Penicillium odoratum]KAJ5769160.1 hypothetical protein N7520_003719 [Penicillium odoratum]